MTQPSPVRRQLFTLGQIVATPAALAAVPEYQRLTSLIRHANGDFGHVSPDDAEQNRFAIAEGERILSAYAICDQKPCKGYGENCFWIITEADRSVTTILLPEDY